MELDSSVGHQGSVFPFSHRFLLTCLHESQTKLSVAEDESAEWFILSDFGCKALPNFICSLRALLMILHSDQKRFKDISKQVEKLMSMGGFPEEKHKIEQKTGKAEQPYYCRRTWRFLLFVVKQWNNITLHNFVLGGLAYPPKKI